MLLKLPDHPFLLAYIFLLLSIEVSCQQSRNLSYIKLKQGFSIDVFAQINNARQLVRGPNGYIYVSTMNNGSIFAIKDTNGDNKADVVKVLAKGLTLPTGIALKDGNLYVAAVSQILRFDDIQNRLDNATYVVVKDDLPTNLAHGWKFIAFGPDDKLYVPIGAPCNVCPEADPYSTITRMNKDGTQFEIFARGIRNTVGFDWDPETGHLWFTDNGRDLMGDDVPPDELNYAPIAGNHYGFPYCHGTDIKDPQYGTKDCNQYTKPKLNFDAHSAALGVNFYTKDAFPQRYRGGMFIAHRGSWNRKEKIGYRVMFVKINGSQIQDNEVFAQGWHQGDIVRGRPVDTQELEDGSLLVSDDHAGLIYRISYSKNSTTIITDLPKVTNTQNTVNIGKIIIIVFCSVGGLIILGIIGYNFYKWDKKKNDQIKNKDNLQTPASNEEMMGPSFTEKGIK